MNNKPFLQEIGLKDKTIDFPADFPFNIPSIKNLPTIKFHKDVTFIVGENGSGKSTFIESVVQWLGLSKTGGGKNNQIQDDSESILSYHLKGVKGYRNPSDCFFLRAESFYNVATYLDDVHQNKAKFASIYGVNSLHECSHGESFLSIIANRLRANGLYFFDEPEAALSSMGQLTVLKLMDKLVQQQSQFIIATHSPILLAYPNSIIYQFDENGVKQINYEETENYKFMKSFIENYKSMIKILMEEE